VVLYPSASVPQQIYRIFQAATTCWSTTIDLLCLRTVAMK
jgi:hypothetical protein